MSAEIEKGQRHAGAPDYDKLRIQNEERIRREVISEFPNVHPEVRESIIKSRVGLANDHIDRSKVVKVDLGENAGRKVKEDLFE